MGGVGYGGGRKKSKCDGSLRKKRHVGIFILGGAAHTFLQLSEGPS